MTSIEDLISNPPLLLHSSLSQLRYLILSEGLPISEDKPQQRTRCYVWTVLSQTSMEASTQRYLALLKLGPPSTTIYQKIKNDTSRTFQTDPNFRNRVSEDALIRCLSCFAWQTQQRRQKTRFGRIPVSTYV